jgi:DNA polymerase III gamma/tau subunit
VNPAIFYSKYAVGWWITWGRAPCVLCIFCADFNFPLYGKKIEMDFALWMECSALSDINYETMNSGNTMTLSANSIVEKCLAKMANDVTIQVRDKLIDIIIAVLTREFEDFDGETVRRHIYVELESTPIAFALEKHVAAASKTPKTPKTKVVELDADGNAVKKVRTPSKEPKEKAPKATKEPKPVLTEEEREARKAAKQAEKEAAKEARKAEKEATKDADKEALKAAAKAEKEAAKEAAKAEKEATKEAAKAEKEATKEAAKAEKEAAKEAAKLAKPAKEQRLPIPWCGKRIDGRCEALRAYHGLFAQCTADATEISAFCPSCQKSGAPFGTVTMRLACGIFDYTAPNGKKCVRLANVLDKFEVEGGMDAFVAEAAKLNITIPYEHLDKEVKQRGRPKSVSPRASATKIATSDSGSETETDDEEYQAKKQQQQQQQRKKVTKTAAAAAADAAPKKRGRPAKAKEAVAEPNDLLIQDLVASAKKSTPVTPTTSTPTATPELSEDVITITPISSPAPAIAVAVAPAAPKKAIKPKAAPKVARKVVELDGDKFWEESFEGMELYVRCSDNIAFDRSNGNGVGTWDDKTKTVIEDNDSEDEE